MTEELDIKYRISRLEDKVLKNQEGRISLFSFLEKLLIPLAIAIAGFIISYSQDKRSAQEAQTALRLKVLEMFYKDISDADPRKQKNALYVLSGVLSDVQPDLAKTLALSVATNPEASLETRQAAEKVAGHIEIVGPLINYSIVIYYLKSDETQKLRADNIKKALTEYAPLTAVSTRPVTAEQLKDWIAPKGNEIRYDELYEKDSAEKLISLLGNVVPDQIFKLQSTSNNKRTENVLTIFLGG
jgi:hypothetical protein